MADSTPKSYHTDPQLYLYTSLSSGSSSIVTATSRLQTILKANKIQFQALDVATDEKARMLWSRRAGKRKLPGLVRMGMILGVRKPDSIYFKGKHAETPSQDLEQVEEWNEYGEVKDNLGSSTTSVSTPTASATNTPSKPPPTSIQESTPINTPTKPPLPTSSNLTTHITPTLDSQPSNPDPTTSLTSTMRQLSLEAARKANDTKQKARNTALETAKSHNPDLQKLDDSAPTGMPPPSGSTQPSEAQKSETGVTAMESQADEVPATSMDDPKGIEAEEQAVQAIDKSATSEEKQGRIPTSSEAEASANSAIAQDKSEEDVLEGTGQAEPETNIPTAKEVEEAANEAIVKDEEGEEHIARMEHEIDNNDTENTREKEEKNKKVTSTVAGEPDIASGKGAMKQPEKKSVEGGAEQNSEAEEEEEESQGNAMENNTAKDVRSEKGKAVSKATAATDSVQDLPGSSTQDQPAGMGEKVGESVGD